MVKNVYLLYREDPYGGCCCGFGVARDLRAVFESLDDCKKYIVSYSKKYDSFAPLWPDTGINIVKFKDIKEDGIERKDGFHWIIEKEKIVTKAKGESDD